MEKFVGIRIPSKMALKLARITDRARDPLAPTKTQILLRGLDLVFQEIEKKR